VKKIYLILFIFTAFMVFSELSFALQTIVVKGNRVLFSLDNSETSQVSVNSLVIAVDKTAQVKIIQVRGVRAVGQVLKGNAKVGQEFRILTGEKKKVLAQSGFLAGLSSNSMSIALSSTNTFKMQGIGFNITGFYDYPFLSDFTLRGMAGYETFKAEGSLSTCPGGKCSVNLNYLTAHGYAQYDVAKYAQGSRFWLGIGAGFLFLTSGSSEIIDTKSMSTNQIMILATGMDVALDGGNALPIQVDYFLYPDGDIKTQQINFRLGYKF
jgi:hypothetical protein